MAYNPKNLSRLIVSLLLMVISLSLVRGSFIVNNNNVAAVEILGTLFCTASGNPTIGVLNLPLVGANVTISCNGGNLTFRNAITDLTGTFNTIATALDTTLFDSTTCVVEANVANVVNCSVYPPNAVVRGGLTFLGIKIENGIGLVAQFLAGAFRVIF